MVKVLFVASEAAPFVKTGGLGDVVGSLPKELVKHGVDVRVILPRYGDIPEHFREKMTLVTTLTVPVGWRKQYCGLFELEQEGIHWYFIDNEQYFKRPGVYGYYDEAERFAYFGRAVLTLIPHLDWQPDILHCHDWQTGVIAPLVKTQYEQYPGVEGLYTIHTIHNLAYQGIFPREVLEDLMGLTDTVFTNDGLEFHGCVNFLKGALAFSDLITTVSCSYAQEIQTPYFGEQLDGFLRKRQRDLHGIVNGIDYEIYDPAADGEIFVNYNWRGTTKRLENKVKLQAALGLPVNKNIPLIGIVSRLVSPKGFDLVARVLDEILALDVQLVVLGSGEAHYQHIFLDAAWRYPGQVSANIGFTDSLSRKIYAGSDLFLMPSRFEPCGIGQLIALRYGSLPVVREVGGLKDTVLAYDKETGEGNGFNFANYNAHDMLYTLEQAVELYKDHKTWAKIMKNAMRADFSWHNSALKYVELYTGLKGPEQQ
ncbi:MAG TPA: glycogen synthase GlgA [Methylomusa anaerophila]|uniref:Glycogen synthase n=1 Tax=Methylomusa anaerophila TaxID=1930071 RepID=A0A348AH34_9FIRM|nr:glycogen synthase GlgA [Methylomusa anaerophila]BBB90382.1 glycogen synthase [Methylomusa anaerophila]HML89271.1 glycogen synthase GlgA [Methylomusa anaerophila]